MSSVDTIPSGPIIQVVKDADKLLQIAMDENSEVPEPTLVDSDASTVTVIPGPGNNEEAQKLLKEKLDKEAKDLEAQAIKMARKNAAGKLVLSAEPYNFFQDISETYECLRTFDLVVQFHTGWAVQSEDIKKFMADVKIKKESVEALGRKPRNKKILLSFKEKALKREVMNTINSKFSHSYKAWTLEDDETVVTLHDVPHKMSDDVIRAALSKFGILDPAETVLHKCDLDFYNLERSLIFTNLTYDIPSFLKIGGYTIQPKYVGQPKTCVLCGSRDHMADDCPQNTRKAIFQPSIKEVKELSMAERIAKSVKESVDLIKDQPGISVNSPKFEEIVKKQLDRFEELAKKRQEKRMAELKQNRPNIKRRSRGNGTDDSSQNERSKKPKEDGFSRVLGRYPKNSSKNSLPPGQHDYFEGDENPFNVLNVSADLHLSGESGDEDRRRDNSSRKGDLVAPRNFMRHLSG